MTTYNPRISSYSLEVSEGGPVKEKIIIDGYELTEAMRVALFESWLPPEPTFDELVAAAREMAISHKYGLGIRHNGFEWAHGLKKQMEELECWLVYLGKKPHDIYDRRACHRDFTPTVALPNDFQILL